MNEKKEHNILLSVHCFFLWAFVQNWYFCARKKHLWVIEHLCVEIPQKKATPPTIFRYSGKMLII